MLALALTSDSTAARLVWTGIILGVAALVAGGLGALWTRNAPDRYARRHLRRAVATTVFLVALVAVALLWRPFGGRIGLVIGFATAGLAFAMQEVLGALAGWYNVLLGHVYRIGDRVEIAGVRGDVLDITPLRTKLLEVGGAPDGTSWVKARQYTGRVVAISNKATFTDPVYNFSAIFEYIWEELTIPVAHDADWRRAEEILREEAAAISRSEGARAALDEMTRRYPVPRQEVEPRVFVRTTDNYLELTARFVVPVRSSRSVKDEVSRRVHDRLAAAGIAVGSSTLDVTLRGARD